MIRALIDRLKEAAEYTRSVSEQIEVCVREMECGVTKQYRKELPGGALLQALNSAPVVMIEMTDPPLDDPEIIFAGHLFEELLGYAHGELLYKPLSVIIPDAKRVVHKTHIEAYQKHPEDKLMGRDRNVQGQKKNGDCINMVVMLKRFFDGGRQFVIATGMFQESDEARISRKVV